jgi:glycosyltransferase involved in cell wall biosynthesis
VQKHAEAASLYENASALYVCSDPSLEKESEIVESEVNGIFTVNVYYRKVKNRIPGISSIQKFSRYLRAHRAGMNIILEKKGRPALVHLNVLWPAGLFALELKRKLNIPFLITEHSTVYQASRNHRFNAFEKSRSKKICSGSALLSTVSQDLAVSMKKLGFGTSFETVNNVLDTNLFYPSPEREKKKFRFLHISTLNDAHKNVSGIIRAMAELVKADPGAELLICGDGDIGPHELFAKQFGLLNRSVFFEGKKEPARVAEAMRNSDCLVLFSNYENMPVVIPEAFACGIPVIATDVGGIKEIVNDSNGMLIPAKNESALTAAMIKMKNEAGKYDAQKLHSFAKEHFSYERVGKKLHQLYNKVLHE